MKFIAGALCFFAVGGWATESLCQWEQASVSTSQSVYCFAPSNSRLFAGTGGAIYFSVDQAKTWAAVSKYMPYVFALAVSDTNMFAGNPGGIFHSSDNGVNWYQANRTLPVASYYAFAVNGSDVFAGSDSGVFLTTNGTDWKPANKGLGGIAVSRLSFSGSNLFAGTFGNGVFVSMNNGTDWTSADNGLPMNATVTAFLPAGAMLFLATKDSGMFISTNNGASWGAAHNIPTNTTVFSLLAIRKNILVGTKSGAIFLSSDSGSNWKDVGAAMINANVLCLDTSGGYIVAGTDGNGIWRIGLSEILGGSSVEDPRKLEQSFKSFPNPFSQSTSIKFTSDNPAFTQISIRNLLGAEVVRLFSGELESGGHSFTWDAHGMPPGMYICTIRIQGKPEELPLMLVK